MDPQNIPQGISTPALNGVASSGTHIVAVGSQLDLSGQPTLKGLILTSSDGVTWTEMPGTIPGTLNAVVWSGNQFVAVGSAYSQSNRQALVYTSSDGFNWTSTVLSQAGDLYDIAWSGTRYVATGYGGAATSTDGFAWQQSGFGLAGVAGNAIAWSGQHFLVCSVADCALSADGLTWSTIQQSMNQLSNIDGITWDGTKWVFVGADSYVATSP